MNKSKLNEEWNTSAVRIPPLSNETVPNLGFKINLKWFHWGFCMCLLREAGYSWKKPLKLWENKHFIYNFITFLVIFFSILNYIKSQKQWEWSLLSDTFTDVSAPDLGCLGKSVYFHFYPQVCNPYSQLCVGLDCSDCTYLTHTGLSGCGGFISCFPVTLLWTLIWISHFWQSDLNVCGDLNSQDASNSRLIESLLVFLIQHLWILRILDCSWCLKCRIWKNPSIEVWVLKYAEYSVPSLQPHRSCE